MIIQGKATEKETWKSVKVDLATAWTLILSFFVIVFNFVLLGNNNSHIFIIIVTAKKLNVYLYL